MTPHPDFDVLLVEDNPHDAELALRACQRSEPACRVTRVKDGREALAWLHARGEAHPGHPLAVIVLLDWKLPLLDGAEVLRALRADERTCDLPVVVLTTCREENDRIDGYGLGVSSYIVKPVDRENLSAAVRAARKPPTPRFA